MVNQEHSCRDVCMLRCDRHSSWVWSVLFPKVFFFYGWKSGIYNPTEGMSVSTSLKPLHFIMISMKKINPRNSKKKHLGILLALVFLVTKPTKTDFAALIIKLKEGKKLGLIPEKGQSKQVRIQDIWGVDHWSLIWTGEWSGSNSVASLDMLDLAHSLGSFNAGAIAAVYTATLKKNMIFRHLGQLSLITTS